MPLLEAPAEYTESSPEPSLQPEIPLFLAPLPGPAAMAQFRLPAAELRLQQQQLQQHQQQQQQQQAERQQQRTILDRRNSYDRDVPIAEETEHYPAFVHLLPVVLPPQVPEPTLDELLVRALFFDMRFFLIFYSPLAATRYTAHGSGTSGNGAATCYFVFDQPIAPLALSATPAATGFERQCAQLSARSWLRPNALDPSQYQQLWPEQLRRHQRSAGHTSAHRRWQYDTASGSTDRAESTAGAAGAQQSHQRAGSALVSRPLPATIGGGTQRESGLSSSTLSRYTASQCGHVAAARRATNQCRTGGRTAGA